MSERAKWMAGIGGLVLLIGGAITAAAIGGYDTSPRSPLVGQAAPPFELPLVAGEGRGDRVSLEALRGEVVALDFWASWCRPCRQSIPVLNRVHQRYNGRVRLYGLNVEPELTADRLQDAHRSFGAAFPTLQDERFQAQSQYGVQSIPTLVLIDQEGVIRHVETGVPDEDDIADRLDDLLAASP